MKLAMPLNVRSLRAGKRRRPQSDRQYSTAALTLGFRASSIESATRSSPWDLFAVVSNRIWRTVFTTILASLGRSR
jgi:hypothetical protein